MFIPKPGTTAEGGTMVRATIPPEHLALIERIARSLIRRLPTHVTTFGDLVSAGYLGYHNALTRYDASRNVRFTTFAERHIRGAMLDALRRADALKRDHRAAKNRREGIEAQFTAQLGRPPTRREVAEHLGVTEDAVEVLDRIPSNPELLVDHADAHSVLAGIPDERMSAQTAFDVCAVREVLRHIEVAFARLSERERYILCARYVLDLGQREIAEQFGITAGRVCQIQWEAIAKLRAAYEAPTAMAA